MRKCWGYGVILWSVIESRKEKDKEPLPENKSLTPCLCYAEQYLGTAAFQISRPVQSSGANFVAAAVIEVINGDYVCAAMPTCPRSKDIGIKSTWLPWLPRASFLSQTAFWVSAAVCKDSSLVLLWEHLRFSWLKFPQRSKFFIRRDSWPVSL